MLALADLSYRFVELPFRGKAKLPGAARRTGCGWRARRCSSASLAIVALGRLERPLRRRRHQPDVRRRLDRRRSPRSSSRSRDRGLTANAGRGAATADAGKPPRIIALGDSVMIGAEDKLAARLGPGFSMNAKVGRQADEFVAIAQRLKREGHHPDAMIIQMGNNGPLYGDDMEALQKATSEVGELFLINDHAPVSWIGRVQPGARRSRRGLAAHDPDRLGLGRRRPRRRALGRDPPEARRRRPLRPPGQRGRARKGRLPSPPPEAEQSRQRRTGAAKRQDGEAPARTG